MRTKELEQIRIGAETDTKIQEMEERYLLLNHENTTPKEKIQQLANLLDEFDRLREQMVPPQKSPRLSDELERIKGILEGTTKKLTNFNMNY
jgi:hypothetical protein